MESFLPCSADVLSAADGIPEAGSSSLAIALSGCILSAAGWRKVFAPSGDEESTDWRVSTGDYHLAALMAHVLRDHCFHDIPETRKSVIALGTDSRPTGPLLADAMMRILTARGVEVRHCGVVTAPQIMAWARLDPALDGFIYISASHNPVGHNGVKAGRKTGGILPGRMVAPAAAAMGKLVADAGTASTLHSLISRTDSGTLGNILAQTGTWQEASARAYRSHLAQVLSGSVDPKVQEEAFTALRQGCLQRRPGLVIDFNGSARCTSVDVALLWDLGVEVRAINDVPGAIAHRIVPEGISLEPCRAELETLHGTDSRFLLGYLPDNDGDRGNLVYWDSGAHTARAMEAQDVFAMACLSELQKAAGTGPSGKGLAVACNDPTSLRVEELADRLGARVFRAEVGEANVVELAESLRSDGWNVPFLGEGSNGGSIVHPSAVRDPLTTVLAMLRLLVMPVPAHRRDGDLGAILATLPEWTTTSVFEERALLRITTLDHQLLKARYETAFLAAWKQDSAWLKERFGFATWECFNHEGLAVRQGMGNRTGAGRGGFRILFRDQEGKDAGFVWMRGSGTEPVFRIMAEVRGKDPAGETLLLDWHRNLVLAADRG